MRFAFKELKKQCIKVWAELNCCGLAVLWTLQSSTENLLPAQRLAPIAGLISQSL